ncbi:glycosyltransferase family 4 protein [Campylobacter sp. MOP51]|uniref:glycosyltransferase family 4 protein n=1 Tax=Campylobacter canis TaxID=3378588 RepID=UPI003C48E93A
MRKALVHDWFSVYAGAEKCVESFTNIWNDFDIYSLVDFFNKDDREIVLKGKRTYTSFIQNLPFAETKYRNYLPLFPFAIERFDLRDYDLILSSSHAVAKGVITTPDQLHISYIHTPIRYAWDLYNQYLRESGLNKGLKGIFAKYCLHKIRLWDLSTINRVDHYIANSKHIAKRIKKIYNKDSTVIYPPVDVDKFRLKENKEDFYFTASRLVPYKKVDLIVEAFAKTNKKLVVIGSGPCMNQIKSKATSNIEILGYQSEKVMIEMMQKSKAFVFAAEEDFGITLVEAQACGTPVICLDRGGAKETVVDMNTGVYFENQSIDSILFALDKFEKVCNLIEPKKVRDNALKFSKDRFEAEIKLFVEKKYNEFKFSS